MQNLILSLIFRLVTEPSTHAGIAAMLAGFMNWLPDSWHAFVQGAIGVFGSLAVALREKAAPAPASPDAQAAADKQSVSGA